MGQPDPHSYFDPDQPRVRRLRLKLEVDFAGRRLDGAVLLELASPAGGALDLDTKGLEILEVETPDGRAVPHTLGADEPIFGRRLRLELPAGAPAVGIR